MPYFHTLRRVDISVNTRYTPPMKQIITAKVNLQTTKEQFEALRATQLAYRDALNAVSRYAHEHGKMSNQQALQRAMYSQIRTVYKLPAQMACNVPRQVGASYKTLWSETKQNATARKAGLTSKRYKGLDTPPKYVSPTLTYNYQRDYSFKTGQRVSILTLNGRVIVPYRGYDKHVALIQEGAEIGAAKLWYDKPKKRFYLLVSLEVEKADPTPETHKQVVGVDVGMRYLAVTSTTKGTCTFHSGKQGRRRANHYARLRKRLQKKGTRSATRRLVAISGRERRLKADANHVVSKRIVTQHPHSLMGLENLTDIRERTRRRTHKRKKNGKGAKPVSIKQRKSNRVYSQWSFAELHMMIAYKALLAGSMAIKVDAHYTSKACPVCGYISDANRPNRGLLFVCQNCHYTLHADLVGARNVAMRTLLARQDWASTGHLSVAPDVSNAETKAAHLRRYAELRWSLDTSPAPLGQG